MIGLLYVVISLFLPIISAYGRQINKSLVNHRQYLIFFNWKYLRNLRQSVAGTIAVCEQKLQHGGLHVLGVWL